MKIHNVPSKQIFIFLDIEYSFKINIRFFKIQIIHSKKLLFFFQIENIRSKEIFIFSKVAVSPPTPSPESPKIDCIQRIFSEL